MKLWVWLFLLLSAFGSAFARGQDFTGVWAIDLRSVQEKQNNVECGGAFFMLTQVGDIISGDHQFYTSHCGRANEGGADTVSGIAVGTTAMLVVTSGRTGTIVMGKATLEGDDLIWQTIKEIHEGEIIDSPLILEEGRLQKLPESGPE